LLVRNGPLNTEELEIVVKAARLGPQPAGGGDVIVRYGILWVKGVLCFEWWKARLLVFDAVVRDSGLVGTRLLEGFQRDAGFSRSGVGHC
jgi:hypothetical protein